MGYRARAGAGAWVIGLGLVLELVLGFFRLGSTLLSFLSTGAASRVAPSVEGQDHAGTEQMSGDASERERHKISQDSTCHHQCHLQVS